MRIVNVRLFAAAMAVLLAAVGVGIIAGEGLPRRLDAAASRINAAVATNYRCPVQDYLAMGTTRACVMNLRSRNVSDAEVVLMGNSHAQMYAPLWASILSDRKQPGLLVPVTGCLPTPTANLTVKCGKAAERNLADVLALDNARTVVLGLTWWHPADGLVAADGSRLSNEDNRALITALDDLIGRIQCAGKQVVLIGPLAEPGWDIASRMSRQLAFGHVTDQPLSMPAAEFTKRFGSVLAHFAARDDIRFAQPHLVQCRGERCEFLLDGDSLFSDSNHLAALALSHFRTGFDAALTKVHRPAE